MFAIARSSQETAPFYDIAEGTELIFLLELTNLKKYLRLTQSDNFSFCIYSQQNTYNNRMQTYSSNIFEKLIVLRLKVVKKSLTHGGQVFCGDGSLIEAVTHFTLFPELSCRLSKEEDSSPIFR